MSKMHYGVHQALEDRADAIIFGSLPPGPSGRAEKSDILTPWKLKVRQSREVHVETGTPDASVRRGNINRVANADRPDLNAREGHVRPQRRGGGRDSLGSFVRGEFDLGEFL